MLTLPISVLTIENRSQLKVILRQLAKCLYLGKYNTKIGPFVSYKMAIGGVGCNFINLCVLCALDPARPFSSKLYASYFPQNLSYFLSMSMLYC